LKEKGILYICPTPIGNLEDITLRVLRVLKEVHLIVAEDTRITCKLLNHYNIKTRLTSYYKYDKVPKTDLILAFLKEGKDIALVVDAGTPILSDPGYELVSQAISQGIEIVSLPGANALIPALVVSGIPIDKFIYHGFLPKRKNKRKKLLLSLQALPYTLVFFVSCHDIIPALEDTLVILGDRQAVLVKELTKVHEKILRKDIKSLINLLKEDKELLKGEFILIVKSEK
jgi:16S rRNA (cytidine1402-2'-O)-methyltransferase